jgi:putative ABC transport system permease protein
MDTLMHDVRYAFRRLLRSPGFSLVAVLTLALGIGANSAIFSVVHGVLLRPLPFDAADRLMLLYTGYPNDEGRYHISAPDFMSIHDGARSFSAVAGAAWGRETLTGDDEPITVQAAAVTERFFEVLGVTPLLGRTFAPEENRPGADGVALLTHAHWRLQHGSDPAVIGRTLMLNGVPREVIGVLPEEVAFPGQRDVYYPLAYDETFSSTTAQGRRSEFLRVVARLAPGVTPEAAATELRAITERLRIEFPETNSANVSLGSIPLREHLLGSARRPLLILLGAVGLVLLIACVNVANLLLARAAAREGEIAVRTALGAGRGRLVRQLLTESMLLGLMGGAAGLALAVVGTQALVAARPDGIPRLDAVGVSGTVVAFTFVVALGTGLLFGLLPATHATGTQLSGSIRGGGRGGTAGRATHRLRRSLIVAEMALAVMLLVGAALLLRSFQQITAVDPGFRSDGLVTFRISLPLAGYPGAPEIRNLYPQLLERVAALPGVESVAAGTVVPMSGSGDILGFDIENREPRPGFVVDASAVSVTPDFFQTLGVPLRAGRFPDSRDVVGAPEVIVVNDAFVRRYFSGEDPLGRRISLGGDEWIEIVGVVGDLPQGSPADGTRPALYAPLEQFTTRTFDVVVRVAGDPLALAGAFRREVSILDPQLPVQQITTGEQLVAAAVAQPRFYTTLLTLFALIALTLAAIGIYGVMSFLVTQRTREIGVRVALGAAPGQVRSLIVKGTLSLALLGVGVGVVGALLGSRLLAGLLFGVGSLDAVAFIGAGGMLLSAAALAGYLPARAATRVDPASALRNE